MCRFYRKAFKDFFGEEYHMSRNLFLTDGRGFAIMQMKLEMTNLKNT